MFETTTPHEDHERMMFEHKVFAKDARNVIASEGTARIERPETYKQWQAWNLRAGFRHLPLNPNIVKVRLRDQLEKSENDGQYWVEAIPSRNRIDGRPDYEDSIKSDIEVKPSLSLDRSEHGKETCSKSCQPTNNIIPYSQWSKESFYDKRVTTK
ncbi:hypothetical protein RJ640_022230 [Escallonia rubra]|uniref:Uncharacterized protein n=1 Tax=Escallonia rubra TaxID=112253 RepID=A0AA88QAJ4_9ASTE|nr:hypothetical protein RJ640_022230 [Escallonia rubra]